MLIPASQVRHNRKSIPGTRRILSSKTRPGAHWIPEKRLEYACSFSTATPVPHMLTPRVLRNLLPVISTALFYALYYAIAAQRFDVAIWTHAIFRDYALNLVLAYALFALSKRAWVFLLLQGLLLGVL